MPAVAEAVVVFTAAVVAAEAGVEPVAAAAAGAAVTITSRTTTGSAVIRVITNWRNGGYWNSRPWNHGWYNGWGGWGWWGANAAAWGVAGLATGAAITGLVDAASENSSPVIVVPNTSYELNYGSVEGVGSYGVSFNYNVDGSSLMGAANCQQGLLNGQVPGTSDQAQLLNAVCQVAYGSGS